MTCHHGHGDVLPLKAWRATAMNLESIVFESTRAKAKLAVVLSARDAGYGVPFTEVRCVRAAEYDGLCDERRELRRGVTYAEWHVQRALEL